MSSVIELYQWLLGLTNNIGISTSTVAFGHRCRLSSSDLFSVKALQGRRSNVVRESLSGGKLTMEER